MANIENHVVSFELAKQLFDAGYQQKSIFWWNLEDGEMKLVFDPFPMQNLDFAAPLATELMANLPKEIQHEGLQGDRWLSLSKLRVNYCSSYDDDSGDNVLNCFDKNPANALAKMWLFFKKQNLLPTPERT